MNVFRSLSAKLLAIYLPLVCISVLVLFAVLEYRYLKNQEQALAAKLHEILFNQGAALASPIWEFDQASIEFLLETAVLDDDVESAAVFDSQGQLMARKGQEADPERPAALEGSREIFYQSTGVRELVGKIAITMRDDRLRREMTTRLQTDAATLLVLFAVLIVTTLVSTRRIIGKPLGALQTAIERTESEGQREKVAWESDDELGRVVRAYNSMQEAQAAAEAEVARYRDHLETLVAERTEELEQSRAELKRKSDVLQAVLDSISQGLAAFDKGLNLITWNRRFLDVRGYPEEMAKIGRPFEDFMRHDVERGEFGPGDPEDQVKERIDRARMFADHQFERRRPSGQYIEIKGGPIPGGGFVSTYSDITERKEAEAALAREKQIVETTLENMDQGITMFDENLNVIAFNQKFLAMLDIPPEVIEADPSLEGLLRFNAERGEYGPGETEEQVRERIELAKKFEAHQIERLRPNGRVLDIRGRPVKTGGSVSTYTDITERKHAEEQLRAAHGQITESIDYASRIQRSVLPAESVLSNDLDDFFVVFEPRDVVGGDLIWHRRCESGFLVAVADCTGHGVPGALMTMIATGALDQALIEIPNGYPPALLQRMNQLVKASLGQDQGNRI